MVCGRLFGKSRFGEPLCCVLANALGKPVDYFVVDNYPASSFADAVESCRFSSILYEMLRGECDSLFVNLLAKPLTIFDLVNEIETILLNNDRFLFLHLDEFDVTTQLKDLGLYPANDTGVDRLYSVWEFCLTPLIEYPPSVSMSPENPLT